MQGEESFTVEVGTGVWRSGVWSRLQKRLRKENVVCRSGSVLDDQSGKLIKVLVYGKGRVEWKGRRRDRVR